MRTIKNDIIILDDDYDLITKVHARIRNIKHIRSHPDVYISKTRELGTRGYIGTMNNQDIIIREVSEIGFSPFAIFRDEIGDEYHHVKALYYTELSAEKVMDILGKYYDISKFKEKTFHSFTRNLDENLEKYYYSKELKIFISLNISGKDTNIIVLATNNDGNLQALVKTLEDLREKKVNSKLNIICFNRSFYLESFEMKLPENEKFGLFDCYNVDFKDKAAEILTKLSVKNGKGIALFHGDVGTGKTSYLRQLIVGLTDKKVIYMPPDLANRIASPEFVTFLMENPDSVLIIEDAENVLRAREAGESVAVSNLLNVSDGILGDALHLQIVCTFNCPIDHIDKALMRPGRLIAEYRFENLAPDRANNLIEKLYGDDVGKVSEPTSLAQVFNMKEELIKSKDKKQKFGFAA